ncbi:MAG: carbohydrate kinase family protein, partial [Thermoleophilia bacterium]
MRPYDLIGCGALNLDLIYRLPADAPLWEQLPPPGSEWSISATERAAVDHEVEGMEAMRSGGGQAANTAWALARLGYRTAMMGRVGRDDDGRFVAGELAPCDGRFLANAGETGRVYVLLNETGERRNLVWPATNDDFDAADLPRRLPRTSFAYFSSFVGEKPLAAQLALLDRLPDDVQVAFDPGEIYARRDVKRFIPLLKRSSFVFATETELQILCGLPVDEAIDFLLQVGVGLVVRKMDEQGARIVGRRIDLYIPPHPAEVVDVTGA